MDRRLRAIQDGEITSKSDYFSGKIDQGQERLVAMVVDYEWDRVSFAEPLSVFSCQFTGQAPVHAPKNDCI